MPKVSVTRVLTKRFKSITDVTFLSPTEQEAVIDMMRECFDTLSVRGRSRMVQEAALSAQHAWNVSIRVDLQTNVPEIVREHDGKLDV